MVETKHLAFGAPIANLRVFVASSRVFFTAASVLLLLAAGAVKAQPAADDPAVALFDEKCADCHSIGEYADLDGPDLEDSQTWSVEDLTAAVEAMEENVDELPASEVAMLVSLLRDGNARQRLTDARAAAEMAANLPPASETNGRGLALGTVRLGNGGLACAACHRMGAEGGTLGSDLSSFGDQLPMVPLISAIQKANYKVMRAAYAEHPITQQEAVDLAAFLKGLEASDAADTSAHIAFACGFVGAALILLALLGLLRSRRSISRGVLLRQSPGR